MIVCYSVLRMKILEVKNLSVETREDGKKLLDKVSFKIEEKSIYALIGPNGSGKSTLASALMGLPRFKVKTGKIIFLGKDITDLPVYQRAKMGMTLAWQNPAYFEGVTVEEFLKVGNKRLTPKELEKNLLLVGLNPQEILARIMDQKLSGGERKRIELASVIAMKPKLIILDEPDSGLDVIIYRELNNILENIRRETGVSLLLITHREESGAIASQATFLNKGKVVYSGGFREAMKKYCQTLNRRKICQGYQKNS